MTESRALVVYQPPKKMGRPTLYADWLADKICELIKTSDRGLDFLCSTRDDLPDTATVYRWLDRYPDFRDKLDRARKVQADYLMDQNFEIADDSSRDYKVIATRNGFIEVFNPEAVARAKLRIDVRTRFAALIHREKWGERVAFTGPDGGPTQIEALRASITSKIDSISQSLGRRTADPAESADDSGTGSPSS